MNKKGASVTPCGTTVVISKKGVSPSGFIYIYGDIYIYIYISVATGP